eukprot:CAMPEP_0172500002 /NCGR_PEP_ID=MMETSP1066-20121228/133326_1 /TAXON_ID=671091 /ORGANISM="Coscinodiscus wailesii, Strain CCMP2513" /LENGTH=555 /DNA_ID=CAMNT_0013274027 /DNA_START=253 /DNA_END=1920 /DNA_ORIENTATION=+
MRLPNPSSLAIALIATSPSTRAFTLYNTHRTPLLTPATSTTSLPSSPDHAPCYDGICSSTPESLPTTPPPAVGTAIARLGLAPGPTVWSEFGRLGALNPQTANLGQGFPDWLPPPFALDSMVEAVLDVAKSPHQYTRTAGHPNLVRELGRRYSSHLGREVDGMNEVAVTVGASQALYLSLQTLLRPGDEVILFEPFFDLYVNQVKLAGGTPVFVPLTFVPYPSSSAAGDEKLTGGEWILERDALDAKISPRTRAIILNSPHNPTGKVFTRSEMEYVAAATLAAGPQCVVLSDEVYKYIIHAPPTEIGDDGTDVAAASAPRAIKCPGHVHFASLPQMSERTLTISSAGKTFSATGWQVGWAIGPPHLISPIQQLLPYVQFCASTVVQEALARTLVRAEDPYEGFSNYYEYLKDKYTKKRDLLAGALRRAGFLLPDWSRTPGGGFFIFARMGEEVRQAIPSERVGRENAAAPSGVTGVDWALCEWMVEEKGVLCIPSSPFFSEESVREGKSDEFVRIAFCKMDETIERAADCFMNLRDDAVAEDHLEVNGRSYRQVV